jgi:hypothetical protein
MSKLNASARLKASVFGFSTLAHIAEGLNLNCYHLRGEGVIELAPATYKGVSRALKDKTLRIALVTKDCLNFKVTLHSSSDDEHTDGRVRSIQDTIKYLHVVEKQTGITCADLMLFLSSIVKESKAK